MKNGTICIINNTSFLCLFLAYGGTTTGPNSQPKQYYCEICDKQLNGPKPYQAHMVSKAHKEEVAAQM